MKTKFLIIVFSVGLLIGDAIGAYIGFEKAVKLLGGKVQK